MKEQNKKRSWEIIFENSKVEERKIKDMKALQFHFYNKVFNVTAAGLSLLQEIDSVVKS